MIVLVVFGAIIVLAVVATASAAYADGYRRAPMR